MNVIDRISESAERFADRPALFARGSLYTYAEIVAVARGIRARIGEKGGLSVARVGIVTGDDLHTYASLLAVWSAGGAYVPLNNSNPPERNGQIVNDAGVSLILTSQPNDDWAEHLPADFDDVDVVQTTKISPDEGQLPVPEISSEHLAYIFYTSGSTGKPKGVPITHGNLELFATTVIDSLGYEFSPEDRFLQMFELTFDLSVFATFVPWCVGASTCVVPKKGIAYINVVNMLIQRNVSVALMVPSMLSYLHRFLDEISLPDLRLSLFCGEALTHDTVEGWSQCIPNGRIENVYGPTEATIFCTNYPWIKDESAAEQVNGVVPIGKEMPGTTAVVIDEDGRQCANGETGELCLIGGQVMAGYWRDEEKNRQAFTDVRVEAGFRRAYRTGDLSYVNDRGNLVYCGRRDSQVKIDGHRIELGEIEHYVRTCIGSSRAAVVVKCDATGHDYLQLFVSAEGLSPDGIQESLRKNLPEYMVPKHVQILDDLPLNLNGKIDRAALMLL